MWAFKILPVEMKVKDFNLSKDALKRLYWMDWYFSHGKNAESTCRHFNISKSVFYRWLPRFNKFNLTKVVVPEPILVLLKMVLIPTILVLTVFPALWDIVDLQ